MNRHPRLSAALFTIAFLGVRHAPFAAAADTKSRCFVFRYHVTITDLPAAKSARVWVPLATSDKHQTVKIRKIDLPGDYRRTRDKRYDNAMISLKAVADKQGRIPIAIDYEVKRTEVTPGNGETAAAAERKQYLRANRLVPLRGKPLKTLFGNRLLGKSRAAMRKLYDRVDAHVRYHKPPGKKWGRGDAAWVCDSRFGNCSDFHSLFISLARSNGVPARFRIGFPIPDKPKGTVGGYHCWAEFADGDRWFSVDISEADKNPKRKDDYFGHLPPDRVAFTTGRDIILEPKQQSGPLNFFIYPHVEVNGKTHTKMEKRFSYQVVR